MTGPFSQSFADPGTNGGTLSRQVSVDLNADVSGFVQGMSQATAQAQQLVQALDGVGQKVDSLAKRAGKTLLHFSVGDFASLSAAVGVAARFEDQLGTMSATAAITGANMTAMKAQLTGVFNQFPVWREQVVQLATAINNMGVSRPKDVGSLTASYTKLGGATGEDATSLASSGISLAKQMGNMDPSKINQFNNALVTLSKNAGVSAQSITDFASSIAPFAKAAGIGQGQLEGISAAFLKVGADGNVAANAFNSLLQQITQLKQAGGDVSRFSGFLGMSRQQFNQMSPLQATAQLFQRIGQGGPGAMQFTQDLGGIRAQAVIQRIAQSGDLMKYANMGQASSVGTANLDKSSQAAFSGLTNAMTNVRNQFTTLADTIGAPLLGPLTELAKLLGSFASGLNTVLKALGPVPQIAATAAGVAAVPAAFGLAHAGLATVLGTGRYAFGKNALWRQAFAAGRGVAGRINAGEDEADVLASDKFAQMITNGDLQPHAVAAFEAGRKAGPRIGQSGGTGFFSQLGQTVMGNWNRVQGRPPPPTPAGGAGGGGGANKVAEMMANIANLAARGGHWYVRQNMEPLEEQGVSGTKRTGARKYRGEEDVDDRSPVRKLFSDALRSPFTLFSSLFSASGAGLRGAAGALPNTPGGLLGKAALGTAGVAASGVSYIGKGLGAITDFVGSNFPMVGLATALGGLVVSKIQEEAAKHQAQVTVSAGDLGESNSAQKMDEQLNQSSSNLATFGDAVGAATDRLNNLANQPLGKQGFKIGQSDIEAATSGGVKVDQLLTDIVREAKGDQGKIKQGVGAWLMSMGEQNPGMSAEEGKTLRQEVLSAVGIDKKDLAQGILDTFQTQYNQTGGAGMGHSFAWFGQRAGQLGAQDYNEGLGDTGQGGTWRNLIATGIAGVKAGTSGAPGTRLADTLNILSGAVSGRSGNQIDRLKAATSIIQTETGIPADKALAFITDYSINKGTAVEYDPLNPNKQYNLNPAFRTPGSEPIHGGGFRSFFDTQTQAGGALSALFTGTPEGRAYLKARGIAAGTLAQNVLTGVPVPSLVSQGTTGLEEIGRQGGVLGRTVAGMSVVQQAIANPLDQPNQNRAINAVMNAALKQVTPGPSQGYDAAAIIRKAAEGTSGALHDIMEAAAGAAEKMQDIASLNFSPLQNAIATIGAGQRMIAAAMAPGGSGEESAQYQTGQGLVTQGITQTGQTVTGLLQGARGYVIGRQRAKIDFGEQRRISNRDFAIQEQRQQEAYDRQVYRTQRDFQISQDRADYQHRISVERANRDFNTQQQRATTQYHLQVFRQVRDFNIQEQRSEENFQIGRTRQIRDYNVQRSRQIRDFNKQQHRETEEYNIQRGREEYQYNLDRQRSIEDFNTSQARALRDFHTQQNREIQHYHTQAARAERDFHKSQARAQEDFNTQMRRQAEKTAQTIYDPWSRIQRKPTVSGGNLLRNLTSQNQAIQKQISNLKKAKDLGLSEQTIQELDLSNPANAQELDALIRSLQHNPRQISQINQQMQQRVSGTKALTQTADNLDYQNAMQDFLTTSKRAWQDYQTSVEDGAKDLATSLKEGYQDFVTQTNDARKDQQKNLDRSAHDFKVNLNNEAADFRRNQKNESSDFKQSLKDSWTDLQTSLNDGLADFKKDMKQAKEDLKTSLADGAVDFETQMANSVHDFKTTMADQESDFKTSRANAAADEKRTLGDMLTDYQTTISQAKQDHGYALADMATQFRTQRDRAAADLKESFHTSTMNLSQQLVELTNIATGQMAKFGPTVVADYISMIQLAAQAMGMVINTPTTSPSAQGGPQTGWTSAPGGPGNGIPGNASGTPQGNASPNTGTAPAKGVAKYASGGISLNQALAIVSESGPELHLPLDKTGEQFMSKAFTTMVQGAAGQHAAAKPKHDMAMVIVKGLAKEIVTALRVEEEHCRHSQMTRNDNTVSITGPIKVVTQDANKMARELQAKAKLARLTSPVKH